MAEATGQRHNDISAQIKPAKMGATFAAMKLAAAGLVGRFHAEAAGDELGASAETASSGVAKLRRELHGIAVALVLVLATTLVALFLRHYLGILRGAVLYLVPVMI